MCGITGYFSSEVADKRVIVSLTNSIKHRGPDDEGYFLFNTKEDCYEIAGGKDTPEGVYKSNLSFAPKKDLSDVNGNFNLLLGHRRLSIIDPTPSGHQPMCNDDGKIWIVFNGEIYNYIEIREELKAKGYEFKTTCDTEVIIKAYEEWGVDCLSKFNGMWAFVILDMNKRLLFGSRDRCGVKPLFYYYRDSKNFTFASEIKALLTLPFYAKEINEIAVFDYLVSGLEEYESESMFKNIMELRPAHYFTFHLDNQNFTIQKYYNLSYHSDFETFNEIKVKDYIENIRSLILDAVKIRLRSDVPVGTCLSGGLDSSTIVCIIDSFLKKERIEQVGLKQKVFTACYKDSPIDESKWAGIVAKSTNVDWFQTNPTGDDLIKDLEDLVYYQDIPFGSTSIYAQYRVIKLAKENGVKVLLDGQGGDELFAGYHTYYKIFLAELIKNGYFNVAFNEFNSLKDKMNIPILSVIKNLINPYMPDFSKFFLGRLKYRELKYLNGSFLRRHKDRVLLEGSSNNLNEFLCKHMTYMNLKTLLRYEDRNSMRFSLEARTPFADDINLIEYVFQIPSIYKIHNGWTKYLLRESTKDILPEEIRWRKDKIGFATPEEDWMKGRMDVFKTYLSEDLQSFLHVKKSDFDGMINSKDVGLIRFAWRMINLSLWYKKFF